MGSGGQDRRLQEKERECVRGCERGSRWDPPRRIWMSAGGEGSFRDRKPRRDLGCGKTKKPRTEVKRKRRKKISIQRERRPPSATTTVHLTSELKSIICKVREEGK